MTDAISLHFTGFDYAVIVIITLSMMISFYRGFVREMTSLVIWVAAFVLGFKFAKPFGAVIHRFLHSEMASYLVAFAAIFVVVFVIGVFINLMIKRVVSLTGLGPVDRLLGVCFGAARGILAAAIIMLLIHVSPFSGSPWFAGSQITPYFNGLVVWLHNFMPEEVAIFSNWIGYQQDDEVNKQIFLNDLDNRGS